MRKSPNVMTRFVLSTLLLLSFSHSHAATLYYLHGKIIEDKGDNAAHPQYGTYEYGNIVAALGRDGHKVISEIRPANTDRIAYAKGIANDIRQRIVEGTPANDIVVIGFSKGAQIAILVSENLASTQVRFVLQAVCGSWVNHYSDIKVHGNILSLYETTDSAGSCTDLFKRSDPSTCEVAITTGLKHGAFYRPNEAWLEPQRDWINQGVCK